MMYNTLSTPLWRNSEFIYLDNIIRAVLSVSECEASAMLPLECQYLNKSALTTLVGPLTPPIKHFQLKRKPKSATLRAELLQKCKCVYVCNGFLKSSICFILI